MKHDLCGCFTFIAKSLHFDTSLPLLARDEQPPQTRTELTMTTPSRSHYTSPPLSSCSSSSRRHRLEARTTSVATTRSSSTLSHYQRRHMPPTLSSYNINTIMSLLDIDLTMTEDSSSSLDAPSTISDHSYNRRHSACKQYEEEENCTTRSQTPKTTDLSPSFSSSNRSCLSKRMHNHAVCRDANSMMWMDVRYCASHTCVACREPQYPKFLPIEPSTTFFKLSRPLAGTRWWERDDADDLLAKLMRPMMEFLNDNACDMMDPLGSAFMMQELPPQQHQQQQHEPMRQTQKLIPPSSFSALPPRCPRRMAPAEHDSQLKSSKNKEKTRRQKKDKYTVEDLPKAEPSSAAAVTYVPFLEV
jgi:hypothetical protein